MRTECADNKSMSSVTELLKIENFLSIKNFEWEIKDFNIITGEMASGKSLCIKLLDFIEQIFHRNIFLVPISKESLDKTNFYDALAKQFNDIFHSSNPYADFCNTIISYSYRCSSSSFDLTAKWDRDSQRLEWNSEYINKNIGEWTSFLGDINTPDAAKSARMQIYEKIKHDFSSTFPIGTEFIPAGRAIATIANPSNIPDAFLKNFINEDKSFVLNFDTVSDKNVNRILHLKEIIIKRNNDNEKTIEVELLNGRKITSLELSSGQQELIYLLLLIRNLFRTNFIYGQTASIFVEEPSAHLFPKEQKESIEYIVGIFRDLKNDREKRARFFITTHSPYILNSLNNILKKGGLLEKYSGRRHEINNAVDIPHLFVKEISAYFIDSDGVGKSLLDERRKYMNDDRIAEISYSIDEDSRKLSELKNEFFDGEVPVD
jgi:ABC-type lipoprotein export system ATPase subunit